MGDRKEVSRREFMTTAAAGAAAFTIVKPESVRGTQANDAIAFGWVGLGGRGTADAKGITAAGGRIVAVCDLFQDKIDAARQTYNLAESACFMGFDGYKKVLDSKLDAVIFTTPPGFRPDEITAAVDAGKHIFAEKPLTAAC